MVLIHVTLFLSIKISVDKNVLEITYTDTEHARLWFLGVVFTAHFTYKDIREK